MDVQISPILQDFVSSGSLRSRCPAPITATITKYQSRARVPMTISCLWATGWALEGFLCRIQGRNFDCMHISQWVDLDLFVQGTKKGQCPVKDGLSTSICPYIHLSPSRRPKQSYGRTKAGSRRAKPGSLKTKPGSRRPRQAQGGPSQSPGGPSQAPGGPNQAQGGPSKAPGGPSQAQGGPSLAPGGQARL